MRINSVISALLRGELLLDPSYALMHMPMMDKILEGKMEPGDRPETFNYALSIGSGGMGIADRRSLVKNEISEPSILILQIEGTLLKNGGLCSYGTKDYIETIELAKSNSFIEGVLIEMDSPGGQADAVPTLADSIRNLGKPVVSFINDGMAASGGYWISAASDLIVSSQKINRVGSIGAMISFRSFKVAMEKAGVKEIIINAPQSGEKNLPFIEAYFNDKYELIKDDLFFLAENFIEAVKELRAGKLNTVEGLDWSKGKLFNADEALQMGLIDAIGNREFALTELVNLINQNKTPHNMFGDKYPKITDLAGKAEDHITDQQVSEINEGFDDKKITGIRVVKASMITDAQTASDKITELNTQLSSEKTAKTTAESKIIGLEKQVGDLTKERDDYKAKADAFGSQPGATPTVAVGVTETEVKTAEGEEKIISQTDFEIAEARKSMTLVKN